MNNKPFGWPESDSIKNHTIVPIPHLFPEHVWQSEIVKYICIFRRNFQASLSNYTAYIPDKIIHRSLKDICWPKLVR